MARADLASSVVMEFTSLAGVMGKHYALQEGRSEAVAEAIFEAALPRSADDVLPKTPAGAHPYRLLPPTPNPSLRAKTTALLNAGSAYSIFERYPLPSARQWSWGLGLGLGSD